MRQDHGTLKRIIQSLPPEVLKKNLALTWKKYKALYETRYVYESLGHVNSLIILSPLIYIV